MVPLSIALTRKHKEIWVVDDVASTRAFLAFHLRQAGYSVWVAANGAEALQLLEKHGRPHLVLLDMHLADLPGLTLAQLLCQHGVSAPIWLRHAPDPLGAEFGAEVLAKPLVVSQLLALVQQRLPDVMASPLVLQEVRVDEHLTLNFAAHYAILDYRQIELTMVESCLLALLFQQRGQVLSHWFLSQKIRQADPSARRALATYVYYLRQKLEGHQAHRRYIRNVPGQGYLMPTVPVDRQPAVRITLPKRRRAKGYYTYPPVA